MYRLTRDHPLVRASNPAVWYLKQCANTVRGAWARLGGLWYMQQGLMAGSVWVDVLRDLELEAADDAAMFSEDAKFVREVMANRTLPGRGMGGPGSEYFSSEVCPKSDNSPFQTCSCHPCTTDPVTNPCKDYPVNKTTGKHLSKGVRLQCKSWADNPLPCVASLACFSRVCACDPPCAWCECVCAVLPTRACTPWCSCWRGLLPRSSILYLLWAAANFCTRNRWRLPQISVPAAPLRPC